MIEEEKQKKINEELCGKSFIITEKLNEIIIEYENILDSEGYKKRDYEVSLVFSIFNFVKDFFREDKILWGLFKYLLSNRFKKNNDIEENKRTISLIDCPHCREIEMSNEFRCYYCKNTKKVWVFEIKDSHPIFYTLNKNELEEIEEGEGE